MEYFLNEVPSLEEIYKDSYRAKDFEMALDGLKRFDEENNYDIFSDDEFLNEIEEMAAMLPDDSQPEEDKKTPFDEDEDEEEKPKKKTVAKKPAKKEEPGDEEEKPAPKKQVVKAPASEKAAKVASYPPLSKMKAFLSQYIDEEYPGMEIPSDLTITELREWYDLAQKGEALPFSEDEEENADQEHETESDDDQTKDEPEAEDEGDGEDERPEEEESPIDEGQTDNDEKLLEAKNAYKL